MSYTRTMARFIVLSIAAVSVSTAQLEHAAAPNANNFAYPQSLFVDSPNGHIWVTDFDHHRVLRFDVSSLTSVEAAERGRIPGTMMLAQNYPNPFNPTTTISFSLHNGGPATVSVSNLLGQEVAVVFDANVTPGTIYAIPFNAQELSSGIYLYSLRSAEGVIVKRMCVLK